MHFLPNILKMTFTGAHLLRRNMYYSMLLTCANYAFPLVVYAWISRALGVSNVGLVGFIDSVTTYFIFFSMMGISVLGMKTIAQSQNDPRRLADSFWSLLALHALFTLTVLAVMVAATCFVDELHRNWRLMCVGMCKLIFNVFIAEWLFTGLEQFRFITIRTLIVKGLYMVSVFLFVRDPADTFTYYLLTMLVVAIIAAINMVYARQRVGVHGIRLDLRHYVSPFFCLGIFAVVTSSYATFNMAFLGFVADDTAVGYFSTASKIISLVSVIFTAYISVVAPRASRLLADNDRAGFRMLARRSYVIIPAVGVPVGLLICLLAPYIVELLSGAGFDGSVAPLRLMAPFVAIIGLGQMVAVQILVPTGREKATAICAGTGFAICIMLNILLTPRMEAMGSAIAWTAAETASLILAVLVSRRQ